MRRIGRNIVVSVRENSAAFGYSITITGSYATLSALDGPVTVADIFAAAVSAGLAFTALELVVIAVYRDVPDQESVTRRLLARMMNFVSISVGVGLAAVCAWLFNGTWAWGLGAFAATVSFILMDALALRVSNAWHESG